MKVLAVDPGLRGSLGWAVLECQPGFLPHLVACGVEDLSRISPRVAAGKIHRFAEKHSVSIVLIEDYFAFPGKERSATAMKKLVGFLEGFFAAKGLAVRLVRASEWKKRLEKLGKDPEKTLLARCPSLQSARKSKRRHILSAICMAAALFYG